MFFEFQPGKHERRAASMFLLRSDVGYMLLVRKKPMVKFLIAFWVTQVILHPVGACDGPGTDNAEYRDAGCFILPCASTSTVDREVV